MKPKQPSKPGIKVFPDFCSSGIWRHPGGWMIDYEDLGISNDLQKEFKAWIRFYDCECTSRRSYCVLAKKASALNERGMDLARKLKGELPRRTVYYWPTGGRDKMGKMVEIMLDKKNKGA